MVGFELIRLQLQLGVWKSWAGEGHCFDRNHPAVPIPALFRDSRSKSLVAPGRTHLLPKRPVSYLDPEVFSLLQFLDPWTFQSAAFLQGRFPWCGLASGPENLSQGAHQASPCELWVCFEPRGLLDRSQSTCPARRPLAWLEFNMSSSPQGGGVQGAFQLVGGWDPFMALLLVEFITGRSCLY